MTIKTLTTTLFLSASFLLFTACDSKVETNATDEQNTTTQVDPSTTLTSLNLTIEKMSLNKDEQTNITLMATYEDNSRKELNTDIEWNITPTDSVDVNGSILTAKKDTKVTVQAKVGKTLSNIITLNIYWEVNGHRLPPEPDPQVNNSTLLGIDINNNNVRDDVERWIYDEYKDKHPIHIDIAMQAGRAYKKVLETPERAKEIRKEVNGALFCGWYYENEAEEFGDPVLVHGRIDVLVKSKYFNTKARNDVYWQYDTLLSGGVYGIPWADEMKSLCDFNTSVYDK